jgi:trehalose 6-phosphate synthase
MTADVSRLVAVSNRLPIRLFQEQGQWGMRPGAGGLVTALAPVLKNRGGLWIGWPGATDLDDPELLQELMWQASQESGYRFHPVDLTTEDIQGYYYGFANEVIWPLFHDLQTRCKFVPEYWQAYREVNAKFAKVIARNCREDDYLWIHDYHLMAVAQTLREMDVHIPSGFFLHIPFPPLDIFMRLPWRAQILLALMEFDLIGFQTLRDRRNFLQCAHHLLGDIKVSGRGMVITLRSGEREVRVGHFPISIDYDQFAETAASQEVSDRAWYLHESFPERQIILGVDRLDYTKGIPERLEAFRRALIRHPELQEQVSLLQVVVPSREEVPAYQQLKADIEQLISQINGQFTRQGWVPIHYMYRHLDQHELLAYYRTADVGLVTPLKDGMNLVAKEYCACNIEENGVLILSEFAGVASQFYRWALMVNPHDVEAVADVIYQACTMDLEECRPRMSKLRESVKRQNIYWWVDAYLKAGTAKQLGDFQTLDEYVPEIGLT